MAAVLIVSPHLADVVLSCWSRLTRSGGLAGTVTVLALHPEAVLYADLPYALRQDFEPRLPAYEPEGRALARELPFHRV